MFQYILTISLYTPQMKKLIRSIYKKYLLDCQRLESPCVVRGVELA